MRCRLLIELTLKRQKIYLMGTPQVFFRSARRDLLKPRKLRFWVIPNWIQKIRRTHRVREVPLGNRLLRTNQLLKETRKIKGSSKTLFNLSKIRFSSKQKTWRHRYSTKQKNLSHPTNPTLGSKTRRIPKISQKPLYHLDKRVVVCSTSLLQLPRPFMTMLIAQILTNNKTWKTSSL